jgi:hypothetical protein
LGATGLELGACLFERLLCSGIDHRKLVAICPGRGVLYAIKLRSVGLEFCGVPLELCITALELRTLTFSALVPSQRGCVMALRRVMMGLAGLLMPLSALRSLLVFGAVHLTIELSAQTGVERDLDTVAAATWALAVWARDPDAPRDLEHELDCKEVIAASLYYWLASTGTLTCPSRITDAARCTSSNPPTRSTPGRSEPPPASPRAHSPKEE